MRRRRAQQLEHARGGLTPARRRLTDAVALARHLSEEHAGSGGPAESDVGGEVAAMVERGDYGQLTEVLEDPQLRATVQRFRYDGGHTLLHKCAILNMPRLADAALPADGSAQEWANESCDAHMTALHICALLDSSAANAALDAAAHFVPSVTRVLLHGGADPNICAKDGSDVRPLHVAAFHGAAATARELIAGGAEVNACDAPQMNTPLHYAAASDSVDVARVLLQSGATCCSNASGWTPLHVAAQWDAGEVAELLLHSVPRRRLTATVSLGADALGMAALFGSDRVLAVMLRHGYGLKRRAHGRTAVHIAAAAGNVTALRMLLDDARARAGSGGAASPEAGAAAGAGAVHSSDGLGADSEPTVPVGICDGTAEQANEAPAAGHWLLRLKDEASGNTVLHEAAAFGGPDVVRVVLNDYLYRDIYVVNEVGNHRRAGLSLHALPDSRCCLHHRLAKLHWTWRRWRVMLTPYISSKTRRRASRKKKVCAFAN